MLLFHSVAVLAAVALAERGIIHFRIGIGAACGFVIAAALFATDLSLRQYAGHSLFPLAAPTGGTLLNSELAYARGGGGMAAAGVRGPTLLPSPQGEGKSAALRRARQSARNRPTLPTVRPAS